MSLLFDESPLIGGTVFAIIGVSWATKSHIAILVVSAIILLFLLYFYRYTPIDVGPVDNNVMICPCEGTVLNVTERYDYYYIAIFLSPFNKHYQIYPVNGKVIKREYDRTGQFNVVMNLGKSRDNEKKLHYILMYNDAVILMTQIAGFLPRVIVSSDENMIVEAGDYLGMIKFGSRVDLIIPKKAPDGSEFVLDIEVDDCLELGDYIGQYVK